VPGFNLSGNMNGTGHGSLRTPAQALINSTYAHIGYTFNGTSTVVYYLNGTAVGSQVGVSTGQNPIVGTTNNYLGWDGQAPFRYLKGNLYQFVIYNRVLSATEMANVYAAG
jgi:hypothetical protein